MKSMEREVLQMKKIGVQLLDSPVFNAVVTVVNGILIIVLVCSLIFVKRHSGSSDGSPVAGESTSGQTGEVQVEELVKEADASMPGIYAALLQGSDFELSEGVEFHFGFNGAYSGFFDADNQYVESYTYSVYSDDSNVIWLKIENPDNSKYVEYQMSFDKDGNILLNYQGMEQGILLEY
jgi:hypothetical protein